MDMHSALRDEVVMHVLDRVSVHRLAIRFDWSKGALSFVHKGMCEYV